MNGKYKRNFKGHSFWALGYYVSTVGLDEAKIRKYIKEQEINESIADKYDRDVNAPFGVRVAGSNAATNPVPRLALGTANCATMNRKEEPLKGCK